VLNDRLNEEYQECGWTRLVNQIVHFSIKVFQVGVVYQDTPTFRITILSDRSWKVCLVLSF
jgi:hypothetical protein